MEPFFTSDMHFGHKRIIEYTNRPFKSVEEMDAQLILNWNNKVPHDAPIYIIGDVSFAKENRTNNILDQLSGIKHLVLGNHDREMVKHHSHHFESINQILTINIRDNDASRGVQSIVLLHYAMLIWDKAHHGAWHLYGHSHGSLPDNPGSLSMDVGVDSNNYTPLSYQEIKKKMSRKVRVAVDHH